MKYFFYSCLIINLLSCNSDTLITQGANTEITAVELKSEYDSLFTILSALEVSERFRYIPKMEKLWANAKTCIDSSDAYRAKISFTLGKLYCDKDSNVSVGLDLYRIAFDFWCKQPHRNDTVLYRVAYNLSIMMNKYGLYESVNPYSDSAIVAAQRLHHLEDVTDALAEKANALCYMRDYTQAQLYGSIALDSAKSQHYFQKMADMNNLLAVVSLGKKDTMLATRYYQQSLNWCEQQKDSIGMAFTLTNLGIFYRDKKKYEHAWSHLNKARSLLEQLQDSIKSANIIMELGHTAAAQRNSKAAISLYEAALRLFGTRKHPYKTECYKGIGDLYLNQNQLDTALISYESGIKAAILNNAKHDTLKSPELLLILSAKAQVLVLKKDFNNALKTYQDCDTLIEYLQRFYRSDESKFLLSEKAKAIYTQAIDLAYKMKAQVAYLTFLKNSKAVLLRQILQDGQAKADLPKMLHQEELTLRTNIVYYQRQIPYDTNYLSAHSKNADSLIYAQAALNQFITKIEKQYPKYYELKWKPNHSWTIADVQSKLTKDQILVEYFLGDTAVYSLGVTQNQFYLLQTKLPKDFKSIIDTFRAVSFELKPNWDTYHQLSDKSHQLYQLLLEKQLSILNPDKQKTRLILIPDDILNTIAFDNLASKPIARVDTTPFSSKPNAWKRFDKRLLLSQYAISYNFAYDIFAEYHAAAATQNVFGSFMPNYGKIKNQQIAPLADADVLMQRLQKMKRFQSGTFHSDQFKNGTKADFLKSAKYYQILFLSMHGKSNDKNPFESGLLFVKNDTLVELLTINEIAAMQLDGNELMVLSACETGKGQVQKGEGVISLSRAFAMSGSKSLILSLSEVEENAAGEIMIGFLENIHNEMPKDVALQRAKIRYAEQYLDSEKSIPGYWAPFILIGDSNPVPMAPNYWLFLSILIGFMVIYWVRRFWKR
jgi:CHAT domain-containing protein